MRREWLIVSAVLVPFAALVVTWCSRSPEAAAQGAQPAVPAHVSVAPVVRAEAAEPPTRPPFASDAAMPEPVTDPPEALAAPIKAVAHEVHACFVDNDAHLHGRVEVTIRFEPTIDGGFAGVSVETALPSPQLTACLEDVFAQMRFEPTGRETFEPARHTFIFDAPPR